MRLNRIDYQFLVIFPLIAAGILKTIFPAMKFTLSFIFFSVLFYGVLEIITKKRNE